MLNILPRLIKCDEPSLTLLGKEVLNFMEDENERSNN